VPNKESWDRRRHVRVRPAVDYDIGVELVEGPLFSRVNVVDLSLGGVGILAEPPMNRYETGAALELRVSPPDAAPFKVEGVVRHTARGVCGVEFQNVSATAVAILRRAVAELLERGHLA
jgi:c-di-GMP-binding flagellar brake protein YcgR